MPRVGRPSGHPQAVVLALATAASHRHAHTPLGGRVGQHRDPRGPLPRPAPLAHLGREQGGVPPSLGLAPLALGGLRLPDFGALGPELGRSGWPAPQRQTGSTRPPRLLPTPQGQGPDLGLAEAPGPTHSERTKCPL